MERIHHTRDARKEAMKAKDLGRATRILTAKSDGQMNYGAGGALIQKRLG
jgi:hypothetical protein